MTSILYYIHDPMCSWCYAFGPVWKEIEKNLSSDVKIEYVLGGLAPDNDNPMLQKKREMVINIWYQIHEMLGTEFNFDFWNKNTPRRSTYPACRAIIAAKSQHFDKKMINAIQQAYYLRALNPSDDSILIQLATELREQFPELNIDIIKFTETLNSEETKQELQNQISLSRSLTRRGFPSLVLKHGDTQHFIEHDYRDPNITISSIDKLLSL